MSPCWGFIHRRRGWRQQSFLPPMSGGVQPKGEVGWQPGPDHGFTEVKNVTIQLYDDKGLMTWMIGSASAVPTFVYDTNSAVSQRIDLPVHETVSEYALDVEVIDSDPELIAYHYDRLGRITRRTAPGGCASDFKHDKDPKEGVQADE